MGGLAAGSTSERDISADRVVRAALRPMRQEVVQNLQDCRRERRQRREEGAQRREEGGQRREPGYQRPARSMNKVVRSAAPNMAELRRSLPAEPHIRDQRPSYKNENFPNFPTDFVFLSLTIIYLPRPRPARTAEGALPGNRARHMIICNVSSSEKSV